MFRKYTNEERERITLEYINHKSEGFLLRKYGVSQGTLKTWKRKYKKDGHTIPNKKVRQKTSGLLEIDRLRLENDILKNFRSSSKYNKKENSIY